MPSLRRIFSQLFEKIGDYLSDDTSYGLGMSEEYAATAKDARARLLAETKALRAHFRETLKAYDQSLAEVQKSLESDKDQALLSKASSITQDLRSTRKALYRALLARQDKQALVTELNEWKQHQAMSHGAKSEIRHERMEMLESELRTRQVYKDAETLPERNVNQSEDDDVNTPAPIEIAVTETEVVQRLPVIELWRSLQPTTQDIEKSWLIVLKKAMHPALDPKASLALMKSFKQAQGAMKQSDKRNNVKRDRIALFEHNFIDR